MQETTSHFYDLSGNPAHTIIGKNGKSRPTTIRDAKALRLLPSVTTIAKILSKPQLSTWRERQVAKAALHYVRQPEEEENDALFDRIRAAAFIQVFEAADLGTNIHAALERHFSDEPYDPAYAVYVEAVDKLMQSENIHVVQRELTLVNPLEGYAGKADLILDTPRGMAIGDYKTRRSKPEYPMEPYDDQAMQIAAYVQAHFGEIKGKAGINIYISSTEPGRVEATWYDDAQLAEELEVFRSLCAIWRIRKGFDARQP